MKTILLSLVSLVVIALHGSAQSPALVAKFGIDGELSNDTLRIGSGTPGGSHDWFKQKAGTGIGLIDTSGTSSFRPLIAAGSNITFTRGQSVARFGIVDNMYMLDARYARDGFGLSTQSGKKDSTVFLTGSQGGGVVFSNKNGDNPNNWHHVIGGTTVQNKNDIIDIYAHMRRNGTVINATNPSPLYLYAGSSTLGIEGERNIDFELFKSRISFNPNTGFSNAGPAETGGHSAWTFNTDGTVRSTGDMLVSFNYNSTSVSDISVFIWVSSITRNTLNPLYFDFIPSDFFGEGPNPAYGYCKITQNGGLPNFEFYATTNSFQSSGPLWGTSSKELGTAPTNYSANDYAAGQFSEIAINLTSLGIDPALGNAGNTTDPCAPPFTRIIVKTRASNTYTSELKDFTGPYPFLDAPQVPQQIKPANLTCTNNTTTLEPLYPQAGAFYVWTTVGGNILTNPISSTVTVSGEGKYYLTASIVNGCLGLTDSLILTRDTYQPVATAQVAGIVNSYFPQQMATLIGGDTVLSNFATPYGYSAGLTWSWTGPNGFSPATTRNAQTNIEGKYTLVVTELRNGCKDTADVQVLSAQTLPVKITEFSAVKKEQEKVLLKWTVMQDTPGEVELMRSFNSTDFTVIAVHMPLSTTESISYTDNTASRTGDKVFYKLRVTEASGHITYSDILVISYGVEINNMQLMPNPVNNYTWVSFKTNKATTGQLQLIDITGKIIRQQYLKAEKGQNQVMVSELEKLGKGIYFIRLYLNETIEVQKLVKQ